jgi:hypothetical protein
LELGFHRLVSVCQARLHALGVDTSALMPMQIIAMIEEEKKKERYRRKVLRCKERADRI